MLLSWFRDAMVAIGLPGRILLWIVTLILALGSFFATLFGWKRSAKYSGAEVIAGDGACGAARSLANLRLLTAEVPPLPLKNCDRPATCKCKYRRFNDRRLSE